MASTEVVATVEVARWRVAVARLAIWYLARMLWLGLLPAGAVEPVCRRIVAFVCAGVRVR
ncbi:hypothetical protein [Cereibacter sphaeroides]|jgi:hypothetical protein|uniref:hypothetical protein n=1 Tax=Cereibacter sphaeroides TaxID=1063 RepID=UPI0002E7D359